MTQRHTHKKNKLAFKENKPWRKIKNKKNKIVGWTSDAVAIKEGRDEFDRQASQSSPSMI